MFLEVLVLNLERIIFSGKAKRIILPGEEGVFEVLPFHKDTISRLLSGKLVIDDIIYPIRRGIVKVEKNKATIIIE